MALKLIRASRTLTTRAARSAAVPFPRLLTTQALQVEDSFFKGAVVSQQGDLEVHWSSGHVDHIDSSWASHQCCCSGCLQAGSGQRVLVPPDNLIDDTLVGVTYDQDHLYLEWANHSHATTLAVQDLERSLAQCSVPRVCPQAAHTLRQHDFTAINTDEFALLQWLDSLARDGAALVNAAPKTVPTSFNGQEADEEGYDYGVISLANQISQPQPTIYGHTFDVRTTETPINIAYSNVALDLHQDLVYYESPPGLQFLQAIEYPTSVQGGESILMDGFVVAERLRTSYPDAFTTLTQIPMVFEKVHYERALPVHLVSKKPLIRLNDEQEIVDVVWAPPFEGVLPLMAPSESRKYFQAYRTFASLIRESNDLLVVHRLDEGQVLCFNNRRMFHGRRAFELQDGAVRHLKGVYVNIDEFASRHAALGHRYGTFQHGMVYGNGQ
eukprot:m.40467 g.40467  ORF g.40467 m.40467 type:complete len:440 (-) comp12745_c0_seq1:70-1389(-)